MSQTGVAYWRPYIQQVAQQEGVPFALLDAVIARESAYNPGAIGDNGKAVGLGQLQPAAARQVGLSPQDRYDPMKNLQGSARYLRYLLGQFGNDPVKAGTAYNVGPGALRKNPSLRGTHDYRGYLEQRLGLPRSAAPQPVVLPTRPLPNMSGVWAARGGRSASLGEVMNKYDPQNSVGVAGPSSMAGATPSVPTTPVAGFAPASLPPAPQASVVTLDQLLPKPAQYVQPTNRQPVGDTFSSLFHGRSPRY